MKVVVGLGNPGSKYAGTRHNVGFDVIGYLMNGPAVTTGRAKFEAVLAESREGDETVLLVKPETFMNLSGRAVRQILDFYKLSPADLFVVCDDINLPVGKLRVRAKGSDGGQKGLRNIREQLGTDEYARLRIGVGQPAPGEAVDYVLSRFKPGEREIIADSVALAAQAVLVWVKQGTEACMNRYNAPDDVKEKPKKDKKPDDKTAGDKPPKPKTDP